MARKVDMQRKLIEQQRDRLLGEIEALRNKVAGLEMALSLMGGEEGVSAEVTSGDRNKGLKQTLVDLLREAGTTGLNAITAVEIAQRRGVHLDRQSVSSTLSRLKRDGIVDYQNDRYRLVQFAGLEAETGGKSEVVFFRNPGS